MTETFIPPHGGYRELLSYQKAEIVYDATVCFCDRFLSRRDRTRDQMIQAARSGKQNIIEGSAASGTSKETEIKLTNVARASLEELLADYNDFLRIHQMPLWPKDSKEALYVRRLSRTVGIREPNGTNGTDVTHEQAQAAARHPADGFHRSPSPDAPHPPYETFRPFIETRPPETVANIIICLIHQANYLLDKQIRHLEKAFVQNGGLREAMTRTRLAQRKRQQNPET